MSVVARPLISLVWSNNRQRVSHITGSVVETKTQNETESWVHFWHETEIATSKYTNVVNWKLLASLNVVFTVYCAAPNLKKND